MSGVFHAYGVILGIPSSCARLGDVRLCGQHLRLIQGYHMVHTIRLSCILSENNGFCFGNAGRAAHLRGLRDVVAME